MGADQDKGQIVFLIKSAAALELFNAVSSIYVFIDHR